MPRTIHFGRTYFRGLSLHLHSQDVPDRPLDPDCGYPEGVEPLENREAALQAAVARTNGVQFQDEGISITLEEQWLACNDAGLHAWKARVNQNSSSTVSNLNGLSGPHVTVKIYDPVFSDVHDLEYYDPFAVVDKFIVYETEAYNLLVQFQGNSIPQFLGLFVASIPQQSNRLVNIVMLEYVHGLTVEELLQKGDFCDRHLKAIARAAAEIGMDFLALGVHLQDWEPSHLVICSDIGDESTFCLDEMCPARSKVNRDKVQVVLKHFGDWQHVPNAPRMYSDPDKRRQAIEDMVKGFERWLNDEETENDE